MIEEATRVVFVNAHARDRVMAKYPGGVGGEGGGRAAGLRGAAAGRAPPSRADGPLRIVYTGRFYDGIRTPETFLEALALVEHSACRCATGSKCSSSARTCSTTPARATTLRLGHSVVFTRPRRAPARAANWRVTPTSC